MVYKFIATSAKMQKRYMQNSQLCNEKSCSDICNAFKKESNAEELITIKYILCKMQIALMHRKPNALV